MEGTLLKTNFYLKFLSLYLYMYSEYILSQMDNFMQKNYSESKCMNKSCALSLKDKSCDTQDLEYSSNDIVFRRSLHVEGHSGNFLCKIKSKIKNLQK